MTYVCTRTYLCPDYLGHSHVSKGPGRRSSGSQRQRTSRCVWLRIVYMITREKERKNYSFYQKIEATFTCTCTCTYTCTCTVQYSETFPYYRQLKTADPYLFSIRTLPSCPSYVEAYTKLLRMPHINRTRYTVPRMHVCNREIPS